MIGENVVRYNAKLFNPLDIDEYSSFYHSQIFPGIIIAVGKSGMTLRTRKMCRKYCIADEASNACKVSTTRRVSSTVSSSY